MLNTNKPQFTLGFIFNKELDRVLLLKKNIENTERTKELKLLLHGRLNGLGGFCEPNETPQQCISREVKEESNIDIPPEHWYNFANLDAQFGYVYCFYTIVDSFYKDNGLIYCQMEDEFLDIYYIKDDRGDFTDFPHMANLEYMIPMALNHTQNLDSAKYFEIKEIYES